jgi:hypothetical protein
VLGIAHLAHGCSRYRSQQQKQRAKKLQKTRWFRAWQRWQIGYKAALAFRSGATDCIAADIDGSKVCNAGSALALSLTTSSRSAAACPCNELELLCAAAWDAKRVERKKSKRATRIRRSLERMAHSERAILRTESSWSSSVSNWARPSSKLQSASELVTMETPVPASRCKSTSPTTFSRATLPPHSES